MIYDFVMYDLKNIIYHKSKNHTSNNLLTHQTYNHDPF